MPVIDKGYPVYPSRGSLQSFIDTSGMAYLTDFGSARSASSASSDWYMPDTYRAPEVLMGVLWDCQVDVWSIGIMVCILRYTALLTYGSSELSSCSSSN